MELILLEHVEKVGRKGDVVRVRDGYARNFLIPRQLALAATRANQQFVEEQRARSEKRKQKERAEAATLAEKLKGLKLEIAARVGEKGKLFGAVTAEVISESLKQKGHVFSKKHIRLREPIRTLGSHQVTVELFPEVHAAITVEVVSQK